MGRASQSLAAGIALSRVVQNFLTQTTPGCAAVRNAITVDVEEYFQVAAFERINLRT